MKDTIYRSVSHESLSSLGVEDFPKCDVCNRPVERVDRHDNYRSGVIVFRVFCHGDQETVELTDAQLARATGLAFGRAFKRKGLLT
jgi:hypothetical protein